MALAETEIEKKTIIKILFSVAEIHGYDSEARSHFRCAMRKVKLSKIYPLKISNLSNGGSACKKKTLVLIMSSRIAAATAPARWFFKLIKKMRWCINLDVIYSLIRFIG